MAPKPLEILRKGLDNLRKKNSAKRDHLLAQLADKKSISSLDEHWLDNDVNITKEQFLLDTLDKESDYERGVENLDDKGKAIVMKLRELARDLLPKVTNKRKREFIVIFSFVQN